MSEAELMLIARLAPTVHVHMLRHGGIASRGRWIAFLQAVQEPATILPCLPAEVDIIRVRRQGKDDTHKDFRVRRQRVEGGLRWLKDNNPAYADIVIDEARLQNLPADGECPISEQSNFLKQQNTWTTKVLPRSSWMQVNQMVAMTQQSLELFFLNQE